MFIYIYSENQEWQYNSQLLAGFKVEYKMDIKVNSGIV